MRRGTVGLLMVALLAWVIASSCSEQDEPPPDIALSDVLLNPRDVGSRLEVTRGPDYKLEDDSATVWMEPNGGGFFDSYAQIADIFHGVNVYTDDTAAKEIFGNIVSSYESFDDPDCWDYWETSCCELGDDPFEYKQTLSSGIGDEAAIFECLSYGLGRQEKPHAEYHGVVRVGRVVATVEVSYSWGFSEQRNPDDSEVSELLRILGLKAKDAQGILN